MIKIEVESIKQDVLINGMTYVLCEKSELASMIKKYNTLKAELEEKNQDIHTFQDGANKMLNTLNLIDEKTGDIKDIEISDIVKLGTSVMMMSKTKREQKFSFIQILIPIFKKYGRVHK